MLSFVSLKIDKLWFSLLPLDFVSNAGALGNVELSCIAIVPRPGVVAPDRVLSMGQIELFDI